MKKESIWKKFKRAMDSQVTDTTGLMDTSIDKRTPTARKRSRFIFLMLLWPVLGTLLGTIMNWSAFWQAFFDFSMGANRPEFVGLENFRRILGMFNTEQINNEWIAVKNSITIFFLTLLVHIPMSVIYAYLLWSKVRGHKWIKGAIYLPNIIGAVVLVLIFKGFFASGPLETIYNLLGISDKYPNQGWLGPDTAWTSIIIFNIWTGFQSNLIFFLAAMNRVPEELVDAAKIDGANEPTICFKVVAPLISRNVVTLGTMSLGVMFSWGTISLLMMRDSTGMNGTGAIGLTILNLVSSKNYGMTAAYGLMLTLIAAPVMLGLRALGNHFVEDVEF